MKNETKIPNNDLWLARKRSGLAPKQVAHLLGQSTQDQLLKYEKGAYLPLLPTALRLAAIYRMPLRLLFQALYEQQKQAVENARRAVPYLFPPVLWFPNSAEQLLQEEPCFYADVLKSRFPSETEFEMVTSHVRAMVNTMSNLKQGSDPFELRSNQAPYV